MAALLGNRSCAIAAVQCVWDTVMVHGWQSCSVASGVLHPRGGAELLPRTSQAGRHISVMWVATEE